MYFKSDSEELSRRHDRTPESMSVESGSQQSGQSRSRCSSSSSEDRPWQSREAMSSSSVWIPKAERSAFALSKTSSSSSVLLPATTTREERYPAEKRDDGGHENAINNGEILLTRVYKMVEKRTSKPLNKCGKLLKCMLPHIGLLLLTWAFIALVAFSMQWAESDNEREQDAKLRAQIERVHAEFVALIVPDQQRPSADLEARIRALEVQLMRLGWAKGRAGVPLPVETAPENTSANAVWTVPNSFLFATSLLARIGYGHMVPLTPLGKVLSQLFAIFGITLFLILIADLAKFYSDFVRALARHIQRVRCIVVNPSAAAAAQKNAVQQDVPCESNISLSEDFYNLYVAYRPSKPYLYTSHAILFTLFCAAMTALYRQMEGWDWLDSTYFVLSSFFCIGFGDFAPSSAHSAWTTVGAIFLGLTPLTCFIDVAGTEYIRKIHFFHSFIGRIAAKIVPKRPQYWNSSDSE